ncbi:hypothetical protein F4777DRAFT_507889 [Nemania sp. FL0916]|nr:hypothetical protein F4777DRAFT_507889 [Nemania sp. FL0916]
MARTKQTAFGSVEAQRISWTRFHLPLEQALPEWPVNYSHTVVGPLAYAEGFQEAWLGRMVDDPTRAAIVILWRQLDDFKRFKESRACAEFLQGLPEDANNSAGSSVVSGSLLQGLSLEFATSPPLPTPPKSRFFVLQDTTSTPTANAEGLLTLTALMIPHRDNSLKWTWLEVVLDAFDWFRPHGCEIIGRGRYGPLRARALATWFWVLNEDAWVDKTFGQAEQTEDGEIARTILCELRPWNGTWDATPELEEVSSQNPLARVSWNQAVARVMPPVTAWVQERWYLRGSGFDALENGEAFMPEKAERE